MRSGNVLCVRSSKCKWVVDSKAKDSASFKVGEDTDLLVQASKVDGDLEELQRLVHDSFPFFNRSLSLSLSIHISIHLIFRGAVKKKWYFWVVGAVGERGGVRSPTTTFGQKSTTFYFCFYSMQKPSKRVKKL